MKDIDENFAKDLLKIVDLGLVADMGLPVDFMVLCLDAKHQIRFKEDGDPLDPFPEGFFEARYSEVF